MLHRELLIDGQFDQGTGDVLIHSPYDGRPVGTAAEGEWVEMDAALEAATQTFRSWRLSARCDRQILLRRIAALVRERAQDLVEILTLEVGKPVTISRGEVARTALTFDLAADLLDKPEARELSLDFDLRGANYECTVHRFPVGPVLAITPYNWPYNLAAHKIAPALAAGNTVVLKPSPLAPLSTLSLARIIHEAGCPQGVLNAVNCNAVNAQRAAIDPRIKFVSFTGSEAVGWKLKSLLSDKKVTLELGGDASVVVMPDADLDLAVEKIVVGAFGFAGQICISVQHVLVHDSIYRVFRDKLIKATQDCVTGDPMHSKTVCGPLIHSEAADRVMEWIQEAEEAGAVVLAGGNRIGNVVEPTLIENVPSSVRIGCEEVFGPVMTLASTDSIEDAVQTISSSKYGIHAGLFTTDESVIEFAFQNLEVGGLIVNDAPTVRFDNMPYGGVKRSGFGREGVSFAYQEMTETKVKLSRI